MVSNREEAIELLLTMSDITKEIAELMKGEAAPPPAEEKKELTLEEVLLIHYGIVIVFRKVFKQLLAGFGVSKLSDVNPRDYWVLMAQAQEANGSAQ